MEANNHPTRLHPLIAAAAIGVLLLSLVGVAAMTGLLPISHGTGSPQNATAERNNTAEAKTNAEQPVNPDGQIAAATQAAAVVNPPAAPPAICHHCGRVESVRTIQTAARPSGVGIAAGAVLGGVLGNQIGGGSGRSLATVAGAVGGGYAGNEIEKRSRTVTSYEVRVRLDDGKIRHFPYKQQPEWRTGDRVRIEDGHLRPL